MFRSVMVAAVVLGWMAGSLAAPSFGQQSRLVELHLVASAAGELGAQQDWAELLETVGADRVQISSIRKPGEAGIEELQSGKTIVVRVNGVIAGGNLSLPGARFSRSDVAGIRNYIQKLRDDGSKVALAEKKAFGLTSEQLVELNQELSVIVEEKTLDLP
ncbi:MAG: hypothetical protein ACKOAH_18305, partial [Pirellula sp.]